MEGKNANVPLFFRKKDMSLTHRIKLQKKLLMEETTLVTWPQILLGGREHKWYSVSFVLRKQIGYFLKVLVTPIVSPNLRELGVVFVFYH